MENTVKKQVRGVNRKLFAYDIKYKNKCFEEIISSIIQNYNPEDALANVPSILEIKPEDINNDTFDKLMLLNKKSIYIQVNNEALADKDSLYIVKKLKEIGYSIVIELNKEDKVFTIAKILADIVKFDIRNIPVGLGDNRFSCKTLAYNVNTAQDYIIAEKAHIDLYEGEFIGETISMDIENYEYSNINFVEIAGILSGKNKDVTIDKLCSIISRDCLLSAQVIRLANSEYFNTRGRVNSIKDALDRIGLESLKKWLFLLQFGRNEYVPEELIQMAYCRALLCGRVANKSNRKIKSEEAYTIGLLSILGELTGEILDKQIAKLRLSENVEDALIYREGDGGLILNLVIAYEETNWSKINKYAKELNVNKKELCKIYFETLNEVNEVWKELTRLGGII